MSKDETYEDLQEPKPEDHELERALDQIRKEYKRNRERCINKPLSAAVYKTWKEVNKRECCGYAERQKE